MGPSIPCLLCLGEQGLLHSPGMERFGAIGPVCVEEMESQTEVDPSEPMGYILEPFWAIESPVAGESE